MTDAFSPRRTLVCLVTFLAIVLTACGSSSTKSATDSPVTLTLYNAQHEDLMQAMVDGFTKSTGIKVQMRNGEDFEMANQIVQEGGASPADVFVTENSPAMSLVDSKGLFAPAGSEAVSHVPAAYVPASKNWVGFAGRSTVLAYNTQKLSAAQLPASIMDLADPKWQGRIGFAPAGADFQAIVSAVLALKGEAATSAWLDGLKRNGKVYQGNMSVMKAVNAGDIDAGVIYHYYWYKDRAESGMNSKNVALDFFGGGDPGGFVSISGAGALKSSKHLEAAQKLVAYLNGVEGQSILAGSKALEYAIGNGAASNPALKPLSELTPPSVEPGSLNGSKVIELMQKSALL